MANSKFPAVSLLFDEVDQQQFKFYMEKSLSLNGLKMRVVSTAEEGEVNTETLFRFTQKDKFVSAEYGGGKVRLGYLIGTISGNSLSFRYVQADTSGRLDSGFSTCKIRRKSNGKIQLIEHFKWDSREGTGINIFEEIEIKTA